MYLKSDIIKLYNEKNFKKINKISKPLLNKFHKDIDVWKIVIFSQINCNNFHSAEKITEELLNSFKTKDIYYLYGNILKKLNKNEDAMLAYKNSIKLGGSSEAYNNLANIQKKLGLLSEAKVNYKKSISSNRRNFQSFFNLASLFHLEKKFDEAIENYKKVLNINENISEAYLQIGNIYATLGKIDLAEINFKLAIEKDERNFLSYENYFSIKKINHNDPIYLKLKKINEEREIKDIDKVTVLMALSKVLFDIEEDTNAFHFLQKAKELRSKNIKFSIKKISKKYERLKNIFSNINSQNFSFKDKYNSYPIFILGMPRSGTSLLEQIISSHSLVHGGGELDLLPKNMDQFDNLLDTDLRSFIEQIRENYLSDLNKISKKKFITDKLPGNFKFVGIILEAIPESKVIHIERNAMAVCWSNYKSNFLFNNGAHYTFTQQNVAEFYSTYQDLINFWKKKYSSKIININYENFVHNFEKETQNLFLKLDLRWEKEVLKFYENDRAVETASFMQIRQNVFRNSSEKWKKYEKYLSPMMQTLKKNKINF